MCCPSLLLLLLLLSLLSQLLMVYLLLLMTVRQIGSDGLAAHLDQGWDILPPQGAAGICRAEG
jgi:hypothetical protein